jgi:trans-aconitate methyltransferase
MSGHWSDPERARRWDADNMEGNPIRAPHLELLVQLVGQSEPGWCLDLGCGSGVVAELILDRWPHLSLFGVDGSPPMLEMARQRLARFGDRSRLDRADLAGGLVAVDAPGCTAAIAVQALHHLNPPELEAVLDWTRGRLRPGSLLTIMDPVLIPSEQLYPTFHKAKELAGWRWNPETFAEYGGGLAEGHDRLLTLESYLAVMRKTGFETACLDVRADRVLLIGRR